MKLPGINYNAPVQSLGRANIMGPITVANAEARALQQFGDLALQTADMIESNEIASVSAAFSNEVAELNAKVKNTKTYDVEELDEAGVDYKQSYDAEDFRFLVPAHEVSTDYYKTESKRIYDKYSSDLGYRGRNVLEKVYAQTYKQGIADVVKQGIIFKQEHARTQAEMEFEDSVNKASMEGAIIIAETARANGSWDPALYASKMGPLPGRIATQEHLIALDSTDSPEELDRMQGDILTDERMTSAQKTSTYKSYDSKIVRMEKAREKAAKEKKVEDSSLQLMDVSADLIDTQQALTGDEYLSEAITMTPPDRKSLLSISRSIGNAPIVTSDDMFREATRLVENLIIPIGNSTITSRKNGVLDILDEMMNDGLTTTDYMMLRDRVTKTVELPFKTTEYKQTEEQIRLTIFGGEKDMMTGIFGTGASSLNMAEIFRDMQTQAEHMGRDFEPRKWWDNSKEMYVTQAIDENERDLIKDVNKTYIKRNTVGSVDLEKSINAVNLQYRQNSITMEFRDRIIQRLGEHTDRDDHLRKGAVK